MCISAHALLSALVARLRRGEGDATADELVAIVGSGCPVVDVDAALAREAGPVFDRARELFARVRTELPPPAARVR